MYTCIAENEAGEDKVDLQLDIQGMEHYMYTYVNVNKTEQNMTVYMCIAENEAGEDNVDLQLDVQGLEHYMYMHVNMNEIKF